VKVRAGPSRVLGVCPAGYQLGDEIVIDGQTVQAVKGPICYVAMSAFTAQVVQIQQRQRVTSHLSCPGCSSETGPENRVIFVLGSEEAWSLAKKYSAYNWARLDGRATEESQQCCDLCWRLTQSGQYADAERAIEQAMEHLKPAR
jgi:uncharacterized repeat protein (TIGR04076 family)